MKLLGKIYRHNKEKGNELINTLGLIIVAVVILLLFKTKLSATFDSAMDKTSSVVENQLFSESSSTTPTT